MVLEFFQQIFHPEAVFGRSLYGESGIYQLDGSCKSYRNYKISDLDMSKYFRVFFFLEYLFAFTQQQPLLVKYFCT